MERGREKEKKREDTLLSTNRTAYVSKVSLSEWPQVCVCLQLSLTGTLSHARGKEEGQECGLGARRDTRQYFRHTHTQVEPIGRDRERPGRGFFLAQRHKQQKVDYSSTLSHLYTL